MGKAKAPPPPDYQALAKQTSANDLKAAQYATSANRINQYNPYGSLTYDKTTNPDGTENWTQNERLSKVGQKLFNADNQSKLALADLQAGAVDRTRDQMSNGFDDSQLAGRAQVFDPNSREMGTAYDGQGMTNNATEAILSRVNPQLERQQAAMESQLLNQGVTRGSQAWNTAIDELGRQRNDATIQAGLQGIQLGQSQQAQRFGQQNSLYSLGAAGQAQQYGQQDAQRKQSLQEQQYFENRDLNQLNALRTGSQTSNPEFERFAQQGQTSGADAMKAGQAQYGAEVANVNARNAGISNAVGGAFKLGMAAFSDIALKQDITRVGTMASGIGLYTYRYIANPAALLLGVMAQDVRKFIPSAVKLMANGYLAVDMGQVCNA